LNGRSIKSQLGGTKVKKGHSLLFYLVIVTLILALVTPTEVTLADSTGSSGNGNIIISRLAGTDRYETAIKISEASWSDKSTKNVILSAGMNDNLVDALTAAPLAKMRNAPILLTQGDKLNANTRDELERLGVTTVYVTSGIGVITQAVLDELKAMSITVVSLGGEDRFATALNIAKEIGMPSKLVVATAYSNADALSIAPIAAAQGMPILLSDSNRLPDSVISYLDSVKSSIEATYLVGGTGVLNETVEQAFPNPSRFGGTDRFDTNRRLIEAFSSTLNGDSVCVANGSDDHLVDALSGSVLAAKNSSAIVLTSELMPDTTKAFLKNNYLVHQAYAFGGNSVVPQSDLEQALSYWTNTDNGITIGSNNSDNPEVISNTLLLTGDNITLQNAAIDYSTYIQGDSCTLTNLNIKGTLYINPKNNGFTSLKNVTASQIIILSGAEKGIQFQDVKADTLRIQSSSKLELAPTGNSSFKSTMVSTPAILDATQGTLGTVHIINTSSPDTIVELKGTFSQSVFVNSAATVRANLNSNMSKLLIFPLDKGAITLEGSFEVVQIEQEANVSLSGTSVINNFVTHAKTNLNVAKGAHVGHLYIGNFGDLTGDGASDLPTVDLSDPYTSLNPVVSQTSDPSVGITYPKAGATLPYGDVDITWNPAMGASGYTVVVSDMDNPLAYLRDYTTNVSEDTRSFKLTTDHIISGHDYVITVFVNKPVDPSAGYSVPSYMPKVSVTIGQNTVQPLTIKSPVKNATIYQGTPVILQWEGPADSERLDAEIMIDSVNGWTSYSALNGSPIEQYMLTPGKHHITVTLRSGSRVLYQASTDITMITR
jgi:putative cell wall-binding protein